jgi:hypothetical protein
MTTVSRHFMETRESGENRDGISSAYVKNLSTMWALASIG